ncbi:MAG TPA: membrane dipeptidase, partial [Gemmatimonadales bacterium]|nr:membrane dipeptidase [Gemmatimonadales bacterium]
MSDSRRTLPAALLALAACATASPTTSPVPDAGLTARTRAVHDRVLALDTHVDISPAAFRLGAPNYGDDLPGRQQVDLVKMERGGLDAAFLIVYVGQSADLTEAGFARANAQALEKFAAIHRLVDSIAPTRAGLARTVLEYTRENARH